MDEQERWLEANTFHCERLRARLTRTQCEINRGLPRIMEDARHTGHVKRPLACDRCKGPGKMKEEGRMSISPNIVQDTLRVLQKATSLRDAVEKLGIQDGALRWRLNHHDELYAVAMERGLIRSRSRVVKADEPDVVRQAKEILEGKPTPAPELEQDPAPVEPKTRQEEPAIEHDRVFEKPLPLLAFKGAVVMFGESYWVDVRVERRVG